MLQAAPDRSGELPHPPADRAHCDRTSAAPCTTNRPYVTLGLVATSILILIVAPHPASDGHAAGLRVSEAVSLRIADIDSQRMLARVVVDRTWEQATRTEGELERYLPDTARGGHAVCLVGYTADGFIVRNSWGPGWGAGGFAYASDDYAADAIHEAYGAVL